VTPLESTVTGSHPAASRLQRHVEALAGTIGERNLWRYSALVQSADYIAGELSRFGYEPVRQSFEVSGVPVSNIEATLPGWSHSAGIIVLGAHYDTVVGCPGANDNATGVAAILDLARRLASRPCRRTLRFVAFVNEEPPFFRTSGMGSVVYANAARARRDRIVGMLSLETMGYYSEEAGSQQYPAPIGPFYPSVGNFIAFVSNVRSARLLFKARRAFKQRTPFPVRAAAVPGSIPGIGWSDHWSFWHAGYPAMMVTDTAPFRYPWYHTPDDTPSRISSSRLAHVVDGLEHVAMVLAEGLSY
jgi:Zn-dependent M28 family amino/carboxypeptidase